MESKNIFGYTVFEDGTVLGKRGKEISFCENGRGYLISRVNWDGRWMTKAKHTIVCEAFHGQRPEGCEAAHINGYSYNNHKDNLRWMTKRENRLQMYKDGRNVSGSKNANAKIDESIAESICKMVQNNPDKSVKDIAESFNVSVPTIRGIVSGKTWKHVTKHYNLKYQGSTTRT